MSDLIRGQQATMFSLDGSGRILRTEQVSYRPEAELARHAQTELARAAAVEVWVESICVLRLGARMSDTE